MNRRSVLNNKAQSLFGLCQIKLFPIFLLFKFIAITILFTTNNPGLQLLNSQYPNLILHNNWNL